MIHSFTCKNFYSFAEETTISLAVNDNAPQDHGYFTTPYGTRLTKAAVVIGANASGKTHLLKVLPFFKWLIVDSPSSKADASIPFMPFWSRQDSPTYLEVVFGIDKKIYTYSFTLTQDQILEEELKVTQMATKRPSTKRLFRRQWSQEEERYIFSGKSFGLSKGFESSLRRDASVISTATNHAGCIPIANFWKQIFSNITEIGWIGDKIVQPTVPPLVKALNLYSDNPEIMQGVAGLLARFDLGISNFKVTKKQKPNNKVGIKVRLEHLFDGDTYDLPLPYESSGTKQLLIVLHDILTALQCGGVAVIDEFEAQLHPEMVSELFLLFMHPESNPNNAQLLFSSHSHLVLNQMDKYQIVLIEKDEKGISDAWRLDEVEGVRLDDNYFGKYISGSYGAIPEFA